MNPHTELTILHWVAVSNLVSHNLTLLGALQGSTDPDSPSATAAAAAVREQTSTGSVSLRNTLRSDRSAPAAENATAIKWDTEGGCRNLSQLL
jgi:hypothetical protein